MRNVVLAAGAIFLLPWVTLGRQTAPPKAPSGTAQTAPAAATAGKPEKLTPEQELTNLFDGKIHAEWEAFKNRDKKAYGELLADDYIAVEADGDGERSKTRMLREVEHSMYTSYNLSFLKVIPLGPEAAFVRYEAFFRFPVKAGVPFEKVLIGEIWVKRGGEWRAIHYQETRVK